MLDPDQPALYFAAATGPASEVVMNRYGEHSKERIPVDASKAGRVFTTGESLIEQAVEADPEHFKDVDRETRRDYALVGLRPARVRRGRERRTPEDRRHADRKQALRRL